MSDPAVPEIPSPVAKSLEQQMDELGLAGDVRHFLRHLHAAEEQLNAAFALAHQGGDAERCASQIYRQLYGKPKPSSPP